LIRILVGPVCFAMFGWLTATHLHLRMEHNVVYALFGALFAIAGFCVLSLVLFTVNFKIGIKGVLAAVAKGFLLMIPFAVLAVLAETVLRWNAVQAFASVGLMSAGGAAGMELAKINGKQMVNGIVASASAFVLTAAWVLLAAPFTVELLKHH
jgi:hypothetical protein